MEPLGDAVEWPRGRTPSRLALSFCHDDIRARRGQTQPMPRLLHRCGPAPLRRLLPAAGGELLTSRRRRPRIVAQLADVHRQPLPTVPPRPFRADPQLPALRRPLRAIGIPIRLLRPEPAAYLRLARRPHRIAARARRRQNQEYHRQTCHPPPFSGRASGIESGKVPDSTLGSPAVPMAKIRPPARGSRMAG